MDLSRNCRHHRLNHLPFTKRVGSERGSQGDWNLFRKIGARAKGSDVEKERIERGSEREEGDRQRRGR